jgi:hypothetical protein
MDWIIDEFYIDSNEPNGDSNRLIIQVISEDQFKIISYSKPKEERGITLYPGEIFSLVFLDRDRWTILGENNKDNE